MLSTAIIIFRETLEIVMILSVVLVATRGLPGRMKWIFGGLASGVSGAGMVALFTQSLSNSFSGVGQELFNACVLFAASLMIGCTVLWMRRHAREMSAHLKKVGHDVVAGALPHYSLSLIIGLSMLREGSEIVMFIYGMILSGQSAASIAAGSTTGMLLGCVAGVMLYYGLLKLPARYTLSVTSWLLLLLVAGLMSQAAGFLSAAGYFSHWSAIVWDTSWLLSENSIAGKTLHSLVGYSATPTIIQLVFYFVTLAFMLAMMRAGNIRHHKHAATVAILVSLLILRPAPASALDEVFSPIVNKGEVAIEYNARRTFDHHSDKNNLQGQEVELEYGVTDRWKAMIAGEGAKNFGESSKYEATNIESIFQFAEQGEYRIDTGLLAAYHIAAQNHKPDSVETKLLLQADTGYFTHNANIGFEQTLGHYSGGTGGPDYTAILSSHYRMAEYIEPGIEFQGDFGQNGTIGHYNKQENYLGPSIYGHLFGHIKYQAAFYAGVSRAAAQTASRILLEYEFHL